MRIALVLSGQARFADMSFAVGLLDYHNYDIFFHTWEDDNQIQVAPWVIRENVYVTSNSELVRLFKPKAFNLTHQNIFENSALRNVCQTDPEVNAIYHMYQSIYLADLCRQEYEANNHFIYDLVIRCRFDFLLLSKIAIESISENCVQTPVLLDHRNSPCDWFFMASSRTMTETTNLYLRLKNYLDSGVSASGEELLKHHFKLSNIRNSNFRTSGILVRDTKLKDVRFGKVAFLDNKTIWVKKIRSNVIIKSRRKLSVAKKLYLIILKYRHGGHRNQNQ